MPLVRPGGEESQPVDEATRRARKVLPKFARGEPRRVAVGLNLPEAELIQGILLEEGIPSFLRRSGGFDVPDFLAAGPRDILVPESGVERARLVLAVDGEPAPIPEEEPLSRVAMRIAAGMLVGLLLFGALAALIFSLIS